MIVSFPNYSHNFRDSHGSGMGIIWEAYHKGVPLLGVPENPIETRLEPNEITEGLDRKTKQVSHSVHLFKV